ncbi:MAG TPA: DUF4440 domain-containing protein [Granulicella sp.]|jgi:hypothetical protein|nr:DUF4440 domain-containing protein [Granulicella sp.]
MLDNYTEKARRVIFFARYECSAFGSPAIESEHLLLGLLREGDGLLDRFLDRIIAAAEIRAVITQSTPLREPTPVSIDVPLSEECQHILNSSAAESARLAHSHIDTEHLLLGILCEEDCWAARLLRDRGLQLDQVRTLLATPTGLTPATWTTRLQQLEENLLDPAVRKDPAQLASLLADDLREFGSSGRAYSKADIIAHLQSEPSSSSTLSLSDFATQLLAPNVVLATYVSTRQDQATGETTQALRSSIWIHRDQSWQMHFHQGTPIP